MHTAGFSYDWDREFATTDPEYYKWTQWIFLQLFKRGLAYQAEVPVNWCPELGTVLSNEEVIDGKSERGGFPVLRMPMKQVPFSSWLIHDFICSAVGWQLLWPSILTACYILPLVQSQRSQTKLRRRLRSVYAALDWIRSSHSDAYLEQIHAKMTIFFACVTMKYICGQQNGCLKRQALAV